MGRRAASAGFAASFMLAFVAKRLPRDPALIVVALAFVLSQFLTSVYELTVRGDRSALASLGFEALFLSLSTAFAYKAFARHGR